MKPPVNIEAEKNSDLLTPLMHPEKKRSAGENL
jgi:hypothetical protein